MYVSRTLSRERASLVGWRVCRIDSSHYKRIQSMRIVARSLFFLTPSGADYHQYFKVRISKISYRLFHAAECIPWPNVHVNHNHLVLYTCRYLVGQHAQFWTHRGHCPHKRSRRIGAFCVSREVTAADHTCFLSKKLPGLSLCVRTYLRNRIGDAQLSEIACTSRYQLVKAIFFLSHFLFSCV